MRESVVSEPIRREGFGLVLKPGENAWENVSKEQEYCFTEHPPVLASLDSLGACSGSFWSGTGIRALIFCFVTIPPQSRSLAGLVR